VSDVGRAAVSQPDRDSLPNFFHLRWIVASAALVSAAALSHGAVAQGFPPGQQPGGANPICQRLVGQLSAIDSGGVGGDPAKADQIRRYEEAQGRQQSELERVQGQAKRQGCDSSGFFSLFSGQSAQCGPINTQIQQMRSNLDQITTNLERLRGGAGSPDRDNQRRSVLMALAQNNCGPQYAGMLRNSGGGFLENLFGGNSNQGGAPLDNGAASGTYRTVCARSCDGFYFPISFATVPSRFPDDERVCKSLCPASDATLFTYRNPGEDMNQAVSINGQPYSQSPNAFKYRQSFDKSCSCKAVGQTWSDALKNIDDKAAAAQQGDIIVTDESSKRMSQPARAPAAAQKKGAVTAPAGAQPLPTGAAPAAPAADASASGDRPIRSVGPTFIPAR
jgi:hypothetical protein